MRTQMPSASSRDTGTTITSLAQAARAGSTAARTQLLSALDDTDPEVRCEAIHALADPAVAGDVPATASVLVRAHIVEVLRLLGLATPETLAAVRTALRDRDSGVRYQAVSTLVALEQPAETVRVLQ